MELLWNKNKAPLDFQDYFELKQKLIMPKAKKSKEDVVKSMNCREDMNRINFSSSPTKTADRR